MSARPGVARRVLRAIIDCSLLLLIGTVLALIWANLAPAAYEHVTHALHFAVNDVAMAMFFALAAAEVRHATGSGGPLSSIETAGTPLLAAAGGMIGPASLFILLARGIGPENLYHGWAIPCATDIAFSALVARAVFGPRHPAVPFLLMLAIADDALGLIILAVFYPAGDVRLVEAGLWMAAAIAVALALRRSHVRSFWPYLLSAGVLSWISLFRGGLHPALALVPIVALMPRGSHADAEGTVPQAKEGTLEAFEHRWKVPVEYVLFAFGLVNAGVSFGSIGIGTWIVLASMLIGKPVGISLATVLGRALRLRTPEGLTWRDVLVVGTLAGIGFTVALFFATAAFPQALLLEQAKMGALFSFGAGPAACALAYLLGVGRFSRDAVVRKSAS
jgi:NhaA family Na+:H+ antiporter